MNRKRLLIIGVCIIVGLGIAALASTAFKKKTDTGTVEIALQFNDTKNIQATLDGQGFKITGLKDDYTLKAGDHTLAIKKTGYDDFSTSFTVTAGQAVYITVGPKLSEHNQQAVTQTAPSVNTSYEGWTITGTHFFSNNMWAVIDLEGEGQILGYAIVQFDAATSSWTTVIAPTSSFSTNTLADNNAPDDLVAYLRGNGLIVDIE